MTDQQITEAIRQGGEAEKAAVTYLTENKDFQACTQRVVRNHLGALRLADWQPLFERSLEVIVTNIKKRQPLKHKTLLDYFEDINRDVGIVEAIRGTDAMRRRAMELIYLDEDYRKAAKSAIRYYGGLRLDEWEGVLNESILQLIKSILKGNYTGGRPLLVYFKGICNIVCKEMGRKEGLLGDVSKIPDEPDPDDPLSFILNEEVREAVRRCMEELTPKCRQILILRMKEIPMKEIAKIMGYENDRTAIVTAKRCRDRLRDILGNDPTINELL